MLILRYLRALSKPKLALSPTINQRSTADNGLHCIYILSTEIFKRKDCIGEQEVGKMALVFQWKARMIPEKRLVKAH